MQQQQLGGACIEEEETAGHVIVASPGVAEYWVRHLGSPRPLPEVVCNVKGLLGFLEGQRKICEFKV